MHSNHEQPDFSLFTPVVNYSFSPVLWRNRQYFIHDCFCGYPAVWMHGRKSNADADCHPVSRVIS